MGQFTGLIRGRGANVAQSGFVSFGDVSLVESVCSVLYVYRKIIVFVHCVYTAVYVGLQYKRNTLGCYSVKTDF